MDFKKYKYKSSPVSKEELLINCNRDCFHFSSPRQSKNLLNLYEYFLSEISSINHLEVIVSKDRPFDSVSGKKNPEIIIRHDIDHDLITAIEMSRMEKRYNLSGTYFLHHTSPCYYGFFDENSVFNRYESAADYYLELQNNGAKVGLHVDPISIYKRGVDGAEAVISELNWLRNIGLRVSSVSAHGSAPYYGAENFEIFEEWCLYKRKSIYCDGVEIPLGVLSAKSLNLEYEANFASPSIDVDWEKIDLYLEEAKTDDLKKHLFYYLHDNPYCRWGQDYTIWLHGRNTWVIASTNPQGIFHFDASTLDVIKFLKSLMHGEKVVLHIHPVYLGYGIHPDLGPLILDYPVKAHYLKSENYLKDLEKLDRIVSTWKKEKDILEKEYAQWRNKVQSLEKECALWKQRAGSPTEFIKYNVKKTLKR
jgi:hypothetical protein